MSAPPWKVDNGNGTFTSPLTYVPVSLEDYRSALLAAGMPEPVVAFVVSSAASMPDGQLGLVDDALPRLLGREPQPLATALQAVLPTPAG